MERRALSHFSLLFLLFISLTYSPYSFGNQGQAPQSRCLSGLRRLGLYTLGTATDLADFPRRIYSRARTLFTDGGFFYSTHRGGFSYLRHLGLFTYDFSGKTIVDVGSGHNGFAPVVNALYGSTGTHVYSFDRYARPNRPGAIADASHLPLASQSADLVLSSWMLAYLYAGGQREHLDAIEEMIRVAKPGGEVRFTLIREAESAEFTEWLKGHPRVESLTQPFTLTLRNHTYVLKLKPEAKNPWPSSPHFATSMKKTLSSSDRTDKERALALWYLLNENPADAGRQFEELPPPTQIQILNALGPLSQLPFRYLSLIEKQILDVKPVPGKTLLVRAYLEARPIIPRALWKSLNIQMKWLGAEDPQFPNELARLLVPQAKSAMNEGNLEAFLSFLESLPDTDIRPALLEAIKVCDIDDGRVIQKNLRRFDKSHPEAVAEIRKALLDRTFIQVNDGGRIPTVKQLKLDPAF